jgi:hypothetical protein
MEPRRWGVVTVFLYLASAPLAAVDRSLSCATQIRTATPAVARLLAEGIARSPTFADVVNRFERSGLLVYVEPGRCPGQEAGGCLLPRVGRCGDARYVRILVDERRLGHAHRQISVIAHELQHALEVAEAQGVTDAASLVELFRRIGYVKADSGRGIAYETEAARRVGDHVLEELRHDRRTSWGDRPISQGCSCASGR